MNILLIGFICVEILLITAQSQSLIEHQFALQYTAL